VKGSRKERDGKEVITMATYRIIRIYEVPGDNQIQATNRMMEALLLRVERDYHVADYVKAPEDAQGKGHKIDLTPPKGWFQLLVEELTAQVTGKPRPVKDGEWKKPVLYKGDGTDIPDADRPEG
jgi:hypothetical protein